MPFVPSSVLLREASRQGYAVGAFNCNNMEFVQAIINAAKTEKAPVIIQVSQGAIKYAGLKYIVAIARVAVEEAGIPAALHLDHGTSFEQLIQCLRAGFSSIMFDGSRLPLEENIAMTKQIVTVARTVGVSVEAELGKIGGTEEDIKVTKREELFTDPEEARYFVEQTGVDSLAVAIGNVHGHYRGKPELDFERLTKIHSLVNIPIVLHGSSGLPPEAITEAIKRGVHKINIDTDIREAFVGAVRRELSNNPDEIDPRKILGPAREAAVEVIREKIRLFGSSRKAL